MEHTFPHELATYHPPAHRLSVIRSYELPPNASKRLRVRKREERRGVNAASAAVGKRGNIEPLLPQLVKPKTPGVTGQNGPEVAPFVPLVPDVIVLPNEDLVR